MRIAVTTLTEYLPAACIYGNGGQSQSILWLLSNVKAVTIFSQTLSGSRSELQSSRISDYIRKSSDDGYTWNHSRYCASAEMGHL